MTVPKLEGIASRLVVGKGVARLVTLGMYDDPLVIFREYIQNAADAHSLDEMAGVGTVEITLDPRNRLLRIRDNGPGLDYESALRELLPIGSSTKNVAKLRGFRGIGRLSGLAFARSVKFSTRASPGSPVTQVVWNRDQFEGHSTQKGQIDSLLKEAVSVHTIPGEDYPNRFFEVEIHEISQFAAGKLLNRNAVRDYISEVCPVPMSSSFPFHCQVESVMNSGEQSFALEVTVNRVTTPIRRPHGPTIDISSRRSDEYQSFERFSIPKLDSEERAAVGWIAHTAYLGAIAKRNRIRGLRVRHGNIQIGGENVFDHLFAEERFNRWCVGELHILDKRIVPNARRDYFEPSPHVRNLENHLSPIVQDISSKCRTASAARNRARKLGIAIEEIEQCRELLASGFLAPEDALPFADRAFKSIERIKEASNDENIDSSLLDRLAKVESRLAEIDLEAVPNPLESLPATYSHAYREVFRALAYLTSTPKEARELMAGILKRPFTVDASKAGRSR